MMEKRVNNLGRGLPPLFGQCPKENMFFFYRAWYRAVLCSNSFAREHKFQLETDGYRLPAAFRHQSVINSMSKILKTHDLTL